MWTSAFIIIGSAQPTRAKVFCSFFSRFLSLFLLLLYSSVSFYPFSLKGTTVSLTIEFDAQVTMTSRTAHFLRLTDLGTRVTGEVGNRYYFVHLFSALPFLTRSQIVPEHLIAATSFYIMNRRTFLICGASRKNHYFRISLIR